MDQATKKEFENLAVMIKHGFDETASKQDLAVFHTEVNTRFEVVDKRLDHLELNTNHISVAMDTIQQDISRVKYLEAKLGVESGK